eukprot:1874406-Pyramimonas_sp.AAC.1
MGEQAQNRARKQCANLHSEPLCGTLTQRLSKLKHLHECWRKRDFCMAATDAPTSPTTNHGNNKLFSSAPRHWKRS